MHRRKRFVHIADFLLNVKINSKSIHSVVSSSVFTHLLLNERFLTSTNKDVSE